jgi:hypothetical protein
MSKRADELRGRAAEAGKRAKAATSREERDKQNKRQTAFNVLAETEDWIDGKMRRKPSES